MLIVFTARSNGDKVIRECIEAGSQPVFPHTLHTEPPYTTALVGGCLVSEGPATHSRPYALYGGSGVHGVGSTPQEPVVRVSVDQPRTKNTQHDSHILRLHLSICLRPVSIDQLCYTEAGELRSNEAVSE